MDRPMNASSPGEPQQVRGLHLVKALLVEALGQQRDNAEQLVAFGHTSFGHTIGEENVLDGDGSIEHKLEGELGELATMADLVRRRSRGIRRYSLELALEWGVGGSVPAAAESAARCGPSLVDAPRDPEPDKLPSLEEFTDAVLASVIPRVRKELDAFKLDQKKKGQRASSKRIVARARR